MDERWPTGRFELRLMEYENRLDLLAGATADGLPVTLSPDRGVDEQQRWYADPVSSRQVLVRHAASGLCLTADDAATGARLRLAPARREGEPGWGLQLWTLARHTWDQTLDGSLVDRCQLLHLGSGSQVAVRGRDVVLARAQEESATAWLPPVDDPKLADALWTPPAIGPEAPEEAFQARTARATPVYRQVSGSGGWRMETASTTGGQVLEEHVLPAGTGLKTVDQNKPVRGWFTVRGDDWLPARPDEVGAVLKTFYRATAGRRAGWVDADALCDLVANADFDAEIVRPGALRWRADVRAYGWPDLSMKVYVVVWNEIDGFLHSDLDGHFTLGHGVKLTHQGAQDSYSLRTVLKQAKWQRGGSTRKTFYETTDTSGGHRYWVDADDIELRNPNSRSNP
ncbi:RICIN domain-containing protein [Kitasatospora sp. NPDC090091]|uniref:RICIN domain-containing protein n=1 Tax=Kitasatospora sp. NPDC090091 TaxID=3364081 RepID=UPI00381E4A21